MAQRHTEESLLTNYLLPPSSLPTIVPISTFFNYHKPGSSNGSTINPTTAQALKKFYRDLQFQRQIDVDTVRLNIERECKRGRVLKARLRNNVRAELRDAGHVVQNPHGRKRKHVAFLENSDGESSYSQGNENDGANGHEMAGGRDGQDAQPESVEPTPYPAALTDPREMALDAKIFGPHGSALPARSQRYHTTKSLLAAMESSIHDLEQEIADLDRQSDRIYSEMNETVGKLNVLQKGELSQSEEDRAMEAEVIHALKNFTDTVNRAVKQTKTESRR